MRGIHPNVGAHNSSSLPKDRIVTRTCPADTMNASRPTGKTKRTRESNSLRYDQTVGFKDIGLLVDSPFTMVAICQGPMP